MVKKIVQVAITMFIVTFSFYYTKLSTDVIKSNNPIMKNIYKEKNKYEKKYINALIKDDVITPGVNGLKVNLEKSFNKMFNYGMYNDSLYVFDEVKPSISINDNYDKYIKNARRDINKVGLLFVVDKNDNIEDIVNILKEENTTATFFIDGVFIDNNKNLIIDMLNNNFEIELYSYNGEYDDICFKNSLQILGELKDSKNMFCFSSYKNKRILNLCSKNHLHTIIPSIDIKNDTYKTIKNNIFNGSIIKMPKYKKELILSIRYIKQRGYKIERLDKLLEE